MNGLEQAFSDQVDFFPLDVDKQESRPYFDEYAIRGRSTYVLLDAEGNEVRRWIGPLNATIDVELEALLAELQ